MPSSASPVRTHRRLLVVSAFAPEQAALLDFAAAELDVREVGIGLVEAAMTTQSLLCAASFSGVVFVGTAGSLGALPLGALCIASACVLVAQAGELPAAMPQRAPCDPVWLARAKTHGFTAASVATTLAIGVTAADAAKLAAYELEHLEAFAVARAAERAGLPFAALLGVANRVGPDGRREWRENHRAVSDALCRSAAALLKEFALGLAS
jgi:futalosine hydrolase